MPKEKFHNPVVENENDNEPILTVAWHNNCPCGDSFVSLNNIKFERTTINRLINTLVKARNSTWGPDQNSSDRVVRVKLIADTSEYVASIENANSATELLVNTLKASVGNAEELATAVSKAVTDQLRRGQIRNA